MNFWQWIIVAAGLLVVARYIMLMSGAVMLYRDCECTRDQAAKAWGKIIPRLVVAAFATAILARLAA